MSVRCFVDSNILVYAHDRSAGPKHERAADLVRQIWRDRSGVLSTQVLQEFYVNVRRKASTPLDPEELRELVEDYLAWEIVVNDGDSVLRAIDVSARFQISFWDGLIVHAANVSGAAILYSEDMNHGQVYSRVTVHNPFIGVQS